MSNTKKTIFDIVAFLAVFAAVLSVVTLFFYPKWKPEEERAQMGGLYLEDKNSLDVLFLGSCNMYTSMSPVLLYEKYGITGYDFTCPDQAMSTTYFYLKDALKRQKPKVVVVEGLFLTCPDTSKRAHYNRLAMEYMPLSLNKIALAAAMVPREVEVMRRYEPDYPNELFTFLSYIFPLLRYHSRDDLSSEDLTFFFDTDLTNYTKGSWIQYNYCRNDGLIWDKVHNWTELTDATKKYLPKIKELCDREGIELFFVKSPNYARWGYDDTYTSVARNAVEELGIPFVDFQSEEYNDFEEYEYGMLSGRLNVYGCRKFTDKMGKYLTENYHLEKTVLTDSQKRRWEDCVKRFYEKAAEMDTPLDRGEIAQISSREKGLFVRWNMQEGCGSYDLYRCKGKDGDYSLIGEDINGNTFLDQDVSNAEGYSYYVVQKEGADSGRGSAPSYSLFVEKPKDAVVENHDGTIHLSWKAGNGNTDFLIQKRKATEFNFGNIKDIDSEKEESEYSWDVDVGEEEIGLLSRYRILAMVEEGGKTYFSEAALLEMIPLKIPVISNCSSSDGANRIEWGDGLPENSWIDVYRREKGAENFEYLGFVKPPEYSYLDRDAEVGKEYEYRIMTEMTNYHVSGRSVSETVSVVTVK